MNYGQNQKFTIVAGWPFRSSGRHGSGSYAPPGSPVTASTTRSPTQEITSASSSGETKLQVYRRIAVGDQVSITTSGYVPSAFGFHRSSVRLRRDLGGIANVYVYGGPVYINA